MKPYFQYTENSLSILHLIKRIVRRKLIFWEKTIKHAIRFPGFILHFLIVDINGPQFACGGGPAVLWRSPQ